MVLFYTRASNSREFGPSGSVPGPRSDVKSRSKPSLAVRLVFALVVTSLTLKEEKKPGVKTKIITSQNETLKQHLVVDDWMRLTFRLLSG